MNRTSFSARSTPRSMPRSMPRATTSIVVVVVALMVQLVVDNRAYAKVPDKRIPPSVQMEVRVVESQFNAALANDCSPDRCYTKGCVYEDHITLDQDRSTSLPGLPAEKGPGSGNAQEYLTRARCSFAYEKSVSKSDVRKLAQRLRRRMSHGWLTVSVTPSSLQAIPKSLLESEPLEDDKPPEVEEPVVVEEPPELTGAVALQQLWAKLLPHFPWMLAIGLVTLAVLMLIWAARRLGAKTIEDKLLEAQLLASQNAPPPESEKEEEEEAVAVIEEIPPPPDESEFAAEQEAIWNKRLDEMTPEDDIITRLLLEWLKAGDYATLARALFVFGDRVAQAFDEVPELALRKVEFATYFREVDEATLPSRAKFFHRLNQQAMASILLSQDDVQLYRSLREDFGASGIVELAKDLPPRYGALLFALVGDDQQREVAALLTQEHRNSIASELLSSTRMSLTEGMYLADCVLAVSEGREVPAAPSDVRAKEHGPPVDSAGALSRLLTHTGSDDRTALFDEVLQRHGGAAPHWFDDIVFNHMLTALPDELRNDLILEVDIRGLAAWLQMQPLAWRRAFIAELSGSLQNALAQNNNTKTRTELVHWAQRGHTELVRAFKSAYARRGLRFVDVAS